MSPRKKLVIDTDGLPDDIRAISLALQQPDVEILAITTVTGFVSAKQACANIARTLRANGKSGIPIYKGAEKSLIGHDESQHESDAFFFGSDGLGGFPDEFPHVLEEDFSIYDPNKPAALALIEIFKHHKDATLVCIGAMTNAALAIKLDSDFVNNVKNMVIMGGNIHGTGNVHSHSSAEFNFFTDPEAAHIVLKEMNCPITIVPWECFIKESEKQSVNFHSHIDIDAPLARYFEMATRIGRKKLEMNGKQFAFCDEIAIGVAIAPEKVIQESKMMRGSVELQGHFTRGQIAIDWIDQLWEHDDTGNARLCRKRNPIKFVLEYNATELEAMLVKAIHDSAALISPKTGA